MTFSIQAKKRTDRSADELRASRLIPAVIYGPQLPATSVAVEYRGFETLYRDAGESSLIDVDMEGGQPVKAIVQAVQYEPIKGKIVHVDFRQIDMTKEMTATVELNFVGESSAVKDLGGTLIKTAESVTVRCLPQNLVGKIDVNISVLASFTDLIHISDLTLPAGITIEQDPSMVLAKVAAPLTEDQLKAMEEAGPKSIEDVEVEKKGKVAEEGAEGADAAGDKKAPADKKEEKKA